jgi:hypothetical protein
MASNGDTIESPKYDGFCIFGDGMRMWNYEIVQEAFEKFQKTQSGKTAREKIEGFV